MRVLAVFLRLGRQVEMLKIHVRLDSRSSGTEQDSTQLNSIVGQWIYRGDWIASLLYQL